MGPCAGNHQKMENKSHNQELHRFLPHRRYIKYVHLCALPWQRKILHLHHGDRFEMLGEHINKHVGYIRYAGCGGGALERVRMNV